MYGARADVADSTGADPLHYTIRQNREDVVLFLMSKTDSSPGLINKGDCEGKTAVHLVVNPLPYGSFENIRILRKL